MESTMLVIPNVAMIIASINAVTVFALAVYWLPGWPRSLTMLLAALFYMFICFLNFGVKM
jgi:hypothetical protein